MREVPHVLGIVLAGGEGKRLYPLTADRAKPAVPFGGAYRLIDFVLSNLVNARYLRICVLTQYKSHSLDRHISQNWRLSGLAGEYITPVPAQQRLGPRWYTGSADAIYQSLNLIYDEDPDYIVVFGADHVYRMDPEQMVRFHIDSGAGATVAGIRVPRENATAFGCIDADDSGRIRSFVEKPLEPPGTPDDPDTTFVSMGNYIFTTKVLIDAIRADADDDHSDHDMGGDIVPRLVADGMAAVYDFSDNEVPGATDRDRAYWRDVGTLDAFYDAHMDLVSVHPVFNLYNKRWPIRGESENLAPAKFVNGGSAQESVVGAGSIISAASARWGAPARALAARVGRTAARQRRRERRPRRPRATSHAAVADQPPRARRLGPVRHWRRHRSNSAWVGALITFSTSCCTLCATAALTASAAA
ncbi:glucose-1-phosphate adenylyltransferase GlgC [Mycobacterium tuberculosis TKK_04_0047]|nr:glucose-1-phosphate adenylyltransferase GlgC [Mycobacterium tuberculosis TKK_04_0047]